MKKLIFVIVAGFRALPVNVAVLLGRNVGWILCHVVRFRRKIVELQIQLAYGDLLSPEERRRLVRDHYRHLGLLVVEWLRLPGASRDEDLDKRLKIHGLKHVEEATQNGQGVIIISGHCGNWEMCGIAIARQNYRITAIGKEMKNEVADFCKRLVRDENGVPTIPRRNSMRQILKALKNRTLVVFMIDQNMTHDEGIFVDFFGQPACTMTAAAVLAERTGVTVLPAFTWRDSDLRTHHCEFRPPCDLSTVSTDSGKRVRHLTQHFTHELEKMIKEHPEQWLWLHKRWKTRPANEAVPAIVYPRRRRRKRN